jgi:hypothetical protein
LTSCEACRLLNISTYSASGTAAGLVANGCQMHCLEPTASHDEPVLVTFSPVLGPGTRLFGDGTLPGALRLLDPTGRR